MFHAAHTIAYVAEAADSSGPAGPGGSMMPDPMQFMQYGALGVLALLIVIIGLLFYFLVPKICAVWSETNKAQVHIATSNVDVAKIHERAIGSVNTALKDMSANVASLDKTMDRLDRNEQERHNYMVTALEANTRSN